MKQSRFVNSCEISQEEIEQCEKQGTIVLLYSKKSLEIKKIKEIGGYSILFSKKDWKIEESLKDKFQKEFENQKRKKD